MKRLPTPFPDQTRPFFQHSAPDPFDAVEMMGAVPAGRLELSFGDSTSITRPPAWYLTPPGPQHCQGGDSPSLRQLLAASEGRGYAALHLGSPGSHGLRPDLPLCLPGVPR